MTKRKQNKKIKKMKTIINSALLMTTVVGLLAPNVLAASNAVSEIEMIDEVQPPYDSGTLDLSMPEPEIGRVSVIGVDVDTQKVLWFSEEFGFVGNNVTLFAEIVEGYELISPDRVTIYMETPEIYHNFYYKKIEDSPEESFSSVTVQYLHNETGQPIAEPTVINDLEIGTEYIGNALVIDGYTIVGPETYTINVSEDPNSNIITFRYDENPVTKEKATVTVKYINEKGESIAEDKIISDLEVGSTHTEEALLIEGYELLSTKVQTIEIQSEGNIITFITYVTSDHYFGRNFDYEISYNEVVTVTPRNYKLNFRKVNDLDTHYAMIGIAAGIADYPLYYDATNEKGLSMAGLNFSGYADYKEIQEGKDNVSPFEFIPWILGQCSTVGEAKKLLKNINLANINYSDELPLSPLHWLLADKEKSIVIESMKDGLHIYDNPVGVLTNNPSFDYQLFNLNNYRVLSSETPKNNFSNQISLNAYSRGMGGIGLPGDLSSVSRFVKATFTKLNSVSGDSESESISQFFHILGSVEQQKGLCDVGDGKYEYTIYSSCCNVDKGIYYYRTYEDSQITAIDMNKEDLDSHKLISYPIIEKQQMIKSV